MSSNYITKAFFVLPKLSSYKFKDAAIQVQITRLVRQFLQMCKQYNIKVCCFVEDMLAVQLLAGEKDVIWYRTIANADYTFLKTCVEDVPEKYWELQAHLVSRQLLKDSIRKFKAVNLSECKDEATYLKKRLEALKQRSRYVAVNTLEGSQMIICLDAHNNFCSLPKVELGDGRMVIHVDINTERRSYTYGGVNLSYEDFNTILKGVTLGNGEDI